MKPRQGAGGHAGVHTEFQGDGERGRRVERVVPSGNLQLEREASGRDGDRDVPRAAVVQHDTAASALVP